MYTDSLKEQAIELQLELEGAELETPSKEKSIKKKPVSKAIPNQKKWKEVIQLKKEIIEKKKLQEEISTLENQKR